MTDHIVSYLRGLIELCDDVPPLDHLGPDDIGTACGTASVARAALARHLDGQPGAVRQRLEGELAEADRLAVWRTRRAWAEFEDAWRDHAGKRHGIVGAEKLDERRILGPLPDDHPLAQRKPWPPELMKCSDDLVRPPTRWFRGIPAGQPCGEFCCRRSRGEDVA